MYSPQLIYPDEENQIFQLGNGRKLHCTFSQATCFPYVEMYTMEDGIIQFETHMPHLRVYASEFERLREALMDFTRYLLWERWDTGDYIKPPVMVELDDPFPSRPNLVVDCSNSFLWLVVRSQSLHVVKDLEKPECMLDKEIYFPIQIAFHAGDLWLLQDVIKIIGTFFANAKERRKMLLLEGRLSGPTHPMWNYPLPDSRRVDLNRPPRLDIHKAPAGATLFSMDNRPENLTAYHGLPPDESKKKIS